MMLSVSSDHLNDPERWGAHVGHDIYFVDHVEMRMKFIITDDGDMLLYPPANEDIQDPSETWIECLTCARRVEDEELPGLQDYGEITNLEAAIISHVVSGGGIRLDRSLDDE